MYQLWSKTDSTKVKHEDFNQRKWSKIVIVGPAVHTYYIYNYTEISILLAASTIINHPMIVRFVTQWLASKMAAPWVAHLRCVERDPTLFQGVSKASCPEKPKDMPV